MGTYKKLSDQGHLLALMPTELEKKNYLISFSIWTLKIKEATTKT